MPFTPDEMREHRAKLKANGVCTHCHAEAARPGYVTCEFCQRTISEQKVNRVDRYKKEGKCVQCATPLDPSWKAQYVTCGVCAEVDRERKIISGGLH